AQSSGMGQDRSLVGESSQRYCWWMSVDAQMPSLVRPGRPWCCQPRHAVSMVSHGRRRPNWRTRY
ncbi:MAG: hypothetical protein LC729_04445, partial [Acidobacteria bacterium]|nr:hypothetical protein [Acidobacteriota bacterium]